VADEVEAWQAGRQWQSMHVVGKPNYTVRHIGREFPPSLKNLQFPSQMAAKLRALNLFSAWTMNYTDISRKHSYNGQ